MAVWHDEFDDLRKVLKAERSPGHDLAVPESSVRFAPSSVPGLTVQIRRYGDAGVSNDAAWTDARVGAAG